MTANAIVQKLWTTASSYGMTGSRMGTETRPCNFKSLSSSRASSFPFLFFADSIATSPALFCAAVRSLLDAL
jgi:hypothetical protein